MRLLNLLNLEQGEYDVSKSLTLFLSIYLCNEKGIEKSIPIKNGSKSYFLHHLNKSPKYEDKNYTFHYLCWYTRLKVNSSSSPKLYSSLELVSDIILPIIFYQISDNYFFIKWVINVPIVYLFKYKQWKWHLLMVRLGSRINPE